MKGGHLANSDHSPDLLLSVDDELLIDTERIDTEHDHGAGDTLAAGSRPRFRARIPVPQALTFAKAGDPLFEAAYLIGGGTAR